MPWRRRKATETATKPSDQTMASGAHSQGESVGPEGDHTKLQNLSLEGMVLPQLVRSTQQSDLMSRIVATQKELDDLRSETLADDSDDGMRSRFVQIRSIVEKQYALVRLTRQELEARFASQETCIGEDALRGDGTAEDVERAKGADLLRGVQRFGSAYEALVDVVAFATRGDMEHLGLTCYDAARDPNSTGIASLPNLIALKIKSTVPALADRLASLLGGTDGGYDPGA